MKSKRLAAETSMNTTEQYCFWNGCDDKLPTCWTVEQIMNHYWNHWYSKMCSKFGRDYVDENYSFQDCLEDWIVVNWAWRKDE
jgi:hypothetical protein